MKYSKILQQPLLGAEKSFINGEKLFTKRKFDHFSADDSRPTMEKDKDKQKL